MGRTSRPVKVLVSPEMLEWDEVKALKDQGHEIESGAMGDWDLVLGPNCWNMDDSLRRYFLTDAIPAARKRAAERKKIIE